MYGKRELDLNKLACILMFTSLLAYIPVHAKHKNDEIFINRAKDIIEFWKLPIKLEAQGVNVDEWNKESKGKDLPEISKKRKMK